MQIYPAIDIKRGRVVRVMEQGGAETVYAADPVAQAEEFLAAGATWLHVVDLDRAYRTGGDNTASVARIVAVAGSSRAWVQVGGLLASADDVTAILATGAARAVVATSAAVDSRALEHIARAAGPERLAVALDVRAGKPVLRGSAHAVALDAEAIATQALGQGIRDVVYRDLDRDGVLGGFELAGAAPLVKLRLRVIVAGGGAALADLEAARDMGLAGAIVGRALYERRFTVREAIECSG